jgi:hypothetical protein
VRCFTTRRLSAAAAAAFLVILLTGVLNAAAAQATVAYEFSFSLSPPEGFSHPVGVAVDESNGDVYVADQGRNMLEKFSVVGGVATQLWKVEVPGVINQLTVDDNPGADHGDVYIAAVGGGSIYKVNEEGTEVKEVAAGLPFPSGVAVDAAGDFFVALDLEGTVAEFNANWEPINAAGTVVGPTDNRVVSGMSPGSGAAEANPQTVAVSSNGEDIYVPTTAGTVQYTRAGSSYTVGATIDPAGTTGVVIAPSGNLFVDRGGEIAEYEASTFTLLATFGKGILASAYGVGVYGSNVYVADYGAAVVQVFEEEVAGVTLTTPVTEPATLEGSQATLHGELLGGQKSYYFAYNTGGVCTGMGGGRTPSIRTRGVEKVSVSVAVPELQSGVPYTYCIVAENATEIASGVGRSVEVKIVPPVAHTGTATFAETTAQLNGSVNPGGGEAKYYFEYGTAACGVSTCGTKSKEGFPLTGSGEQSVTAIEVNGLTSATVYHYRIVAVGSKGEIAYGDEKSFMTYPQEAPSEVQTEAPEGVVMQNKAQLTGLLNSGGSAHYYFEYSSSPCNATLNTCGTKSSLAGPLVEFGHQQKAPPIEVVGLLPATTYHYWLVATNPLGTSHGQEETFTTASVVAPTQASTEPAEVVGVTSAYLSGEVDPGGSATYYFEYGVSQCGATTCGAKTTEYTELGETKKVVESVGVESLLPGTTYYYRIVATNGQGTVYGKQQAFTTQPAPPRPEEPKSKPGPKVETKSESKVESKVESKSSTPTIAILKVKVKSDALVVTVKVSAEGTVKISGAGLKTITKNVAAGTRQLTIPLTAKGKTARKRHKKVKITGALKVGTLTVSSSETVKL